MLWVFGVVFVLFALVNLWLATKAAAGITEGSGIADPRRLERALLRGSFENAAIAALCVAGWYFMRRSTRSALFAGVAAVAVGLFITSCRWLYWEIRGPNPLSWAEPLLVWPFLVYVILYGYREGRKKEIAEPNAADNRQ